MPTPTFLVLHGLPDRLLAGYTLGLCFYHIIYTSVFACSISQVRTICKNLLKFIEITAELSFEIRNSTQTYKVLHTKQNENYKLYQYQRAHFSYLQRRQKSSNSEAACPSFCSNRPRGFRNSYSRKVSSSMQRIPKTSCSHTKSHLFTYQVLSQNNSTHLKLASFSGDLRAQLH